MFFWNKKRKVIYLDHASATPVKRQALDEFVRVSEKYFSNASSIHTKGGESRQFLEDLRKKFAYLIRAKKSEIYFVNSSTEANNIFIKGLVYKHLHNNFTPHIITSLGEHSSILEPILYLQKRGTEISFVNLDEKGRIKSEEVTKLIQENTVLIALSSVSSETGNISPIREIAVNLQKINTNRVNKIKLYTDATQSVEYDKIDVGTLMCDGMTFGARKIGALGGTALLFIKTGTELEPVIHGGGQENGVKAGTENLGLIAAFYKVLENLLNNKQTKLDNYQHITQLKLCLINEINQNLFNKVEIIGSVKVKNSIFADSTPHIILVHVPKILGEEIVLRLDAKGIQLSTASACSVLEGSGSNTLKAMGKDKEAKETLRISLGEENTLEDIKYFINTLKDILAKYQK